MNMNDKLVLINRSTLEALEEIDVINVIERFTKTGMQVLGADFGFMFWKPDGKNFYQVIYKSPETPYNPALPRKKGYNHKAAEGRTPYFVSDPVSFVLPYMKSLAIIPVFYKKHQYGNIVLCFKNRREFLPEETPLMTTFGNCAAQALTIHLAHKKSERDYLKLLQQKNEFFNIVSHELKTPVTTIRGFSQILLNKKTFDDRKQALYFLEKITKQSDKLSRLINDLLVVSRIETRKFVFEHKHFELGEAVAQTIENLRVAIKTHTISFKSAGKFWVQGDAHRIEAVLINLVTNAAKYSPPNTKIKVALEYKDGNAHIDVEDFGFGIPERDREKVFNRFYQSPSSNKMNMPGLGLGLYIANTIVKHHGGTLNFTSKKKSSGTVFYFTIPCYKYKVNKK